MDNKNVGWIVIGISIVIIGIVFLFNFTLREIVKSSCTGEHAITCPMYDTITKQTYLALAIVGILVIFGLFLVLSKPNEKIVVRKIKEPRINKKIDLSELRRDERDVLKLIQENGAIFQGDLIDKTGFGKAKMSRIVDRLEGKGFVERKRRGMTNIVVLKD